MRAPQKWAHRELPNKLPSSDTSDEDPVVQLPMDMGGEDDVPPRHGISYGKTFGFRAKK